RADASSRATRAGRGAQQAPPLAADAGRLTVAATNSVKLGATLNALAAQGGSDGVFELAARKIAVVDGPGQSGIDATFLQVGASDLSRLRTRLLLGATADDAGDLSAVPSAVVVAHGAGSRPH